MIYMIYFLYGTDSYRIHEKKQELLAKFLAGDKNGMNLEKIDGAEMPLARFEQTISAVSFFSGDKIVVIENLLTQNKDSELKGKIAERIKRELNIKMIFVEYGEPDKREKLFKVLSKSQNIYAFSSLSDYELRQWISGAIKKRNFNIERAAVEALAVALGANLWRQKNEIEKLILYVKSQNDEGGEQKRDKIELQDIKEMVESEFSPNVFNFIEAIATSNKKNSVKLLQQFLNNGENENYLLSMIIYQFRTLIKIKDLLDHNRGSAAIASEAKISPYVIQKSLPILRRYSLGDLIEYYQKLYNYDVKIKTGLISAKVAVDLLVAG